MKEPRSVIAKNFVVDMAPDKVLDFFLNLKNWESGGVLKNIRKTAGEWWEADSPQGKVRIKLWPNKAAGIFDHDFDGGGGRWTVYCRVTPNEGGSTVSWLFVRPEAMSQMEFESQLGSSFEKEMECFKRAVISIR